MSQIWIEKLRSATSKVERDEILLRDFFAAQKHRSRGELVLAQRHEDEVEEQMVALADLAISGER